MLFGNTLILYLIWVYIESKNYELGSTGQFDIMSYTNSKVGGLHRMQRQDGACCVCGILVYMSTRIFGCVVFVE